MSQREELRGMLRCPRCRGMENLRFEGDFAVCVGCGGRYRVERDVVRFDESPYVAEFGRQWNRYEVVRPEEDERVFRVKAGVSSAELGGLLVLDAGCGGGRYALLLGKAGARVIGIDLSSAVEMAAKICTELPDVLIVQGDLTAPPVAEAGFDFVFSIGVLHHGPAPREAFSAIARRVRPGGRLSVWLYRKNSLPQELINKALRFVTTRLPSPVLEKLCVPLAVLGSIPLVNRSLNKVFNFSNHRDWTLRVCDNFDWYAPKHQSHHTAAELRSWFLEEGFEEVRELRPERSGRVYDWLFRNNLIIGSGVNFTGRRRG